MSSVGSASETSSHSSFSTGTGGSVISNSQSDVGALSKLDRDQDASIQDLLQQNKGLWDAAFSCLLLLTKNRAVKGYRMLAFRVVFEYLQIFRLVFNTRFLWVINTDLWIWKAFYWVLFRFLVWNMGYDKYVMGAYVIAGVVLALAVLTIVIAVVLRKDDSANIWVSRVIWFLQNGALLVFSICWVAVLDYLVFMFTCSWGSDNKHHHWTTVECTKMPHLASMVFSGVTAVITIVVVACLAMAECSGNLVSDNLMASPVAETAFKTTALKIIMVCVSTCLDQFPQPQAVLMFISPCLSAYLQIRSSPYLLPWMNHLWTGLWCTLVYTTGLQLVLHYYQVEEPYSLEVPSVQLAFQESMTWAVLYGIFPALLLGMGISWLVQRWKSKPIQLFVQAQQEAAAGRMHTESVAVLKSIYRFHSPDQVAFLARCVRRFDPITDQVMPEAAALCNLIIQAALTRFPNHPTVLLVYANYVIHVKKEPRAARQQLQLASKGEPGIIERYNIFAANDVLKRNRSDSDAGLDLMAYVEFQRNYRACVKAHKLALLAQRAFWRSLMHDSLKLTDMLAGFKAMEAAEQTSIYVYKRVLERYPQNGKLLKVWGRFQEWVLHDPARASRSYAEAIKRGLGDNMLNLTSDDADSGTMNDVSNKVDEKLDGVVIIDAGGSILMANKVAYRMFGYGRGELEGKNVNVLMPQPFSGRHDSYLSNYLTTGVAKILNTRRSVVALTKDRTIFPLSLMVTRLSGTGMESVFMGVMRVAEDEDSNIVRVWCTTAGLILCCDAKLGAWFGLNSSELTGRPISTLGQDPEAIDRFVKDACGPHKAAAAAGTLKLQTSFLHKYLQSLEVELTATFGGSEAEVMLVLHIRSVNEAQRLMVVDDKLRILYASDTMAKLLGTSVVSLRERSLPSLIVPPAAQLHKRWIADMGGVRPPPGSCRAGSIVPMLGHNGAKVPVLLDIKTVEQATNDHVQHLHIIKVQAATNEQQLDSQRVSLTVDQRGMVLAASASPKSLFGFDPPADLVGQPLAAFISTFEEFRVRNKAMAAQQGGSGIGGGGATGSAVHNTSLSGQQGPGEQKYSQLALQIAPAPQPGSSSGGGSSSGSGSIDADDSMLLMLLAQAAQEGSEACYRVGVRATPLAADKIGLSADQQRQEQAAGLSLLLAAMQGRGGNKLRPALMRIDVLETDWTQQDAGCQGVQFQVQLWSAEQVQGSLEIDSRLKVFKADPSVGQMLGLAGSEVNKKALNRLLSLPGYVKEGADLLQSQGQGQKKASALKKKHSSKEPAVGPLLTVEAAHADGEPVQLQLQAVAKEGQASRLLLCVKLAQPASIGTLPALLQLCGAGSMFGIKPPKHLAAAAGSAAAAAGAASVKLRQQQQQQQGLKSKAGLGSSSSGGGGSRNSSVDLDAEGPSRVKPAGARSGARRSAEYAEEGRAAGRGQQGHRSDAAAAGGSKGLRFAAEGSEEQEEGGGGRHRAHTGKGMGSGRFLRGGVPDESEGATDVATDAATDAAGVDWDAEGYSDDPGAQQQGGTKWQEMRSPIPSGPGGTNLVGALKGAGALQSSLYQPSAGGRGSLEMAAWTGGSAGPQRGSMDRAPLLPGGQRSSMEGYGPPAEYEGPGGYDRGPAGGRGSMDRGAAGGRGSIELGPGAAGGAGGVGDDAASDGGSEEEGSKLDMGSASEADDGEFGDEDVTCDWRRAKRLRRILRQLDSPIARAPLLRFWRGTWGVTAVLLLAHVVCYAVLATIIGQRHTDVYGVQQLANAVDKSQMILLRANFISKCAFPQNEVLAVCSPAQRAVYLAKSLSNVEAMKSLHAGVFLGSDPSKVMKLSDTELLDWWMLPLQTEHVFFDTNPPSTATAQISLWNLGNRFIHAAQEMNYLAKVLLYDGQSLEASRYWQYVVENGKDTLFKGYSISLDLYVLFCWAQLGGLATLLTGLLVAELVAVALLAMAFQLDLVRRVAKQRMACFSVFLALPSATLRTMATAPCHVDEDDEDNSEAEEDMELMGGQPEGDTSMAPDASAKVNKSVRMAVVDSAEDPSSATAAGAAGKSSKHKKSRLLKGKEELPGALGWAARKYKAVRHAARGIFNRVIHVNGKKLHPARGAFASFMLPLLTWWIVALVIFGVSFQKINMLQEPLTSMQAAAHVQFNIARIRMVANMIAFLPEPYATAERTELVQTLNVELAALQSEYFSMLYGGALKLATNSSEPVYSTAALFRDGHIADLFFRTTACLRVDQSTCYTPDSPWYDVSNHGIDVMVQRFMSELRTFSLLPPANQSAVQPCYEYTWRVAATDLYDGLTSVSNAFVGTTLTALDDLQQLHTYLLIASIALFVGLVVIMLLPYKKCLVMESVRLAGLLSQLPQESDVEGQVKLLVLDPNSTHKHTTDASKQWSLARGVTAAAAAAARAAASRAAGAVGNIKARMAEASAANAAAAAEAEWRQQEAGWQQYQGGDAASEDASSAADWE